MTQFKYQEQFAAELAMKWHHGDCVYVRTTIRSLKNKAQAAYIAGEVVYQLAVNDSLEAAKGFISFMHPNNSTSALKVEATTSINDGFGGGGVSTQESIVSGASKGVGPQ